MVQDFRVKVMILSIAHHSYTTFFGWIYHDLSKVWVLQSRKNPGAFSNLTHSVLLYAPATIPP